MLFKKRKNSRVFYNILYITSVKKLNYTIIFNKIYVNLSFFFVAKRLGGGEIAPYIEPHLSHHKTKPLAVVQY